MRLCILASGSGSNFEAIQTAILEEELSAEIVCVISDKMDAYVHKRAHKHEIPTYFINFKEHPTRAAAEHSMSLIIDTYNPDYIVCAGYMKILGNDFVNKYSGKILNIHPSKLPKYKGLNALQQALDNNEKEIGVSVHYVDESLDGGRILKQVVFPIYEDESLSEIESKLHQHEHKLYVEVLKNIREIKNEKGIN